MVKKDRLKGRKSQMEVQLSRFFKEDKLVQIPKKQKSKLELFDYLADRFEYGKEYSEKEVNEILKNVYDDYALLRRYLVDYHYLNRDNYGKMYQRVASKENE